MLVQSNLHQVTVQLIREVQNAMNLRRREWLVFCGLGVVALVLERGNKVLWVEDRMRGLIPGAEEYLKARADARSAQRERHAYRQRIFKQPEVRHAWLRLAHDRFTSPPTNCDLDVQSIGEGHVRGIVPKSVEDRASGDLLRIIYGDWGDHYMRGTLRLGPNGETVPFFIYALEEDGHALFTVNAWRLEQNNRDVGMTKNLAFLDNAAMSVLARLFNCTDPRFVFVGSGDRPVVLDRPKMRYAGPGGIDLYLSDRSAFLDQYVDQHYASAGLNPSSGRLDPDSIPKPANRRDG